MPDFVHPLQGLLSGAQTGIQLGQSMAQQQMQRKQMALQASQVEQQRKQQEWENDFRVISTGVSLAQSKGMSPESSSKILNESVAPLWKKWSGNDFPQMTPQTMQDFMPIVKNISALGQQAAEGKMDWGMAFQEANSQLANYHANSQKSLEIADREKAALDAAMAPLKHGYESQQKAAPKASSSEDIFKRMTDIERQLADMDKVDQNMALIMATNPEFAKRPDVLKISPESQARTRAAAYLELRQLNDRLPQGSRREYISKQEYDKMIGLGYTDEFIRSNAIVMPDQKPAAPAPGAAPGVAGGQ